MLSAGLSPRAPPMQPSEHVKVEFVQIPNTVTVPVFPKRTFTVGFGCEVCSAVLDSTRNILVLTADGRTFELPVGYSERLHARISEIIGEPDPV